MSGRIACLIVVTLLAACGGDSASPVPEAPANPEGVLASARTAEIVINWHDASGETHYRVEYRREGESSWQLLSELPSNATSVTHINVTRNVQYFYRVAACNTVGCSGWSEVSAKWQSTGEPPTLLSSDVAGIGGNVATLKAVARSGGVPVTFVFSLARPAEAAPFFTSEPVYVETPQPGVAELELTGFTVVNILQPGTEYVLSVRASNEYGMSPPIVTKTFRTTLIGPPSFTNMRNGILGNGLPGFIVDVHANGNTTEYRFELARAGDSFAAPIATESSYAPGDRDSWLAFTSSLPSLAQPGVTYKWRMVGINSAGTTVSDTLQYTRQ